MSETFGPEGRYQTDERIAVGGMGAVWRARDTVLGREVALKLLKPELAQDPTFRQRFAAEARNAASLHHANIATVFDYGTERDADGQERPYLVMELVRGRPLSDLLQPGRPMPADTARRIAVQVADALAAAHAAGIVHRDIKPANVLVLPDGRVKVTDFGIARAADAVALTGTNEMIGTPHYISPEQAEGKQASPASDVYSLGVVLYELLAGRRPFVADTPVATALAHVRTPAPDLPDGVPPDLRAVVRTSLAKDPGQRYRDGAAMRAALEGRSVEGTAVADAPTEVAAPVIAAAPEQTAVMPAVRPEPVTPVAAERERPRKKESPIPTWAIVAGVVALIVIVTAVVLGLRGGNGDEQPTTPTTPSDTASGSPTQQQTSRTPSPTKEPTTRKPTPTRTPSSTPTQEPSSTPTATPSDTASASPSSQGRVQEPQ